MVKITVKTKCDFIIGFDYNGHAGYAEYGEDIVCSALTAQIMMTVNGVTEILGFPAEVSHNDGGKLSFMIPEKYVKEESVQVLMKTLKLGIETIQIEYGKFITLIKEEV